MLRPLTLHTEAFWVSPWDCSVFVALREKGLEFSTTIVTLREGMGLVTQVQEQTVTGSAPALQHGDFWVAESLAIVEYLEDAFPPPGHPRIFPADVRERARARQIMTFLRLAFRVLQNERPSQLIFYPETPPPLTANGERNAAELLQLAERLGVGASGRIFAEPCLADVELAFALMRLVVSAHPIAAPVRAFAEAVWARPAVREFVRHGRPPYPPRPLVIHLH
jgi:glutathione S-transferase